jgi:phosphomannomutase
MAIDKSILDSYTNGYKFYLDDLKNRNIKGEDYDEVEKNYNRLIELGEQCSDLTEFNAKMMEENISTKISNAYSHAIMGNINNNMPNMGMSGAASMAGGAIMNATSKIAASAGLNVNIPGVSQLGNVSGIGSKLKGLFSSSKNEKDDDSGSSRQYKIRRT